MARTNKVKLCFLFNQPVTQLVSVSPPLARQIYDSEANISQHHKNEVEYQIKNKIDSLRGDKSYCPIKQNSSLRGVGQKLFYQQDKKKCSLQVSKTPNTKQHTTHKLYSTETKYHLIYLKYSG